MKNRWAQLAASLLAMIMIANLQYAWTLFVAPLQAAHHWKLSDIQWAFTLFIIFETWVMPVEGWLIDRAGPRLFTSIAGVLCGFGWAGLAYAETLWQLYAFYAVAGTGAAFVYSGAIAGAIKWFPDRRGLAAGIIAGGFGAGSAVFIPVFSAMIRDYGYRTTFIASGIVQGLVIFMVAQVLRHPPAVVASASAKPAVGQFSTLQMLRTPKFYVLYAMFVMMATGGLLVVAQAAPVAREWGISAAALTAALSLDRVANGLSRVSWGWLSDRVGREQTMFIAFALHAGCLLSILWVGRQSGFLFTVTLVLTFFTWGEAFSLFPSILGDYFGSANAASNYSFLYTAKGVAAIIGGGLAALLFEKFGSWSAAFYGSAALALTSALMALGLKIARARHKAS